MEIKQFLTPSAKKGFNWGGYTNTYMIINDGKAILVDPGFDIEIPEELKQYEITAILLTHGHIDHIASINSFNVPIYIHKDERQFLFDNRLNLADMFSYPYKGDSDKKIIELDDNMVVTINGIDIKVIHTPGHTIGSVCYLIDDSLISGDTLFQVGVGRTDFYTGSFKMLNESLLKLIGSLDNNTKVYPGHGEMTTIAIEKKYNPYYLDAINQKNNIRF